MKCEKKAKKKEKSIQTKKPDVKSLKNAAICFSMVDLLCKVLIPTQSFLHFSQLYNNQLN